MCAREREHEYQELEITHLIVYPRDEAVYASAREPCCGKIYAFLISNRDNGVYARNGLQDSWQEINGREAEFIRALARKTQYNGLAPVFKANEPFNWQ